MKAFRWPTAVLAGIAVCAGSFAASRLELNTVGAEAFGSRRVEALVGLPPEGWKDWGAPEWQSWSEDASTLLMEAYRDEGYFDARCAILPPSPDSTRKSGALVILIQVVEGPHYQFDSVSVRLPTGNFPTFEVNSLRSRNGRGFDRTLLFRDRRDLLQFYGDKGFLKVQAAESLYYDTTRKAVEVAFRVNPGQALVFDTLLLHIVREGDTLGHPGKTAPDLLRDLFPVQRGDTLPLNRMSSYERKLKSTRVYNFVRVSDSVLPNAEGRSALVLNAEEKVPGELDVSGFWESLYGLGTGLNWSHDNLGGRLHEGKVGLSFAQRKQSLALGYASPLLFGTPIRFDNDVTVNWYQDQPPVLGEPAFHGNFDVSNQSKLSRQLLAWMRFVTTAELLGSSELIDSLHRQRDFNLNYLNSLFLQDLDDIVNPTRGARLALTWGNGGPLLRKGELSVFQQRHNWLEYESGFYLPATPWVDLALRFDGGRFFGAGGINAERFFLGGPRSIRSVDWRRVCPEMDSTGFCVTDGVEPAYFLASAEIRLQPFQPGWISPEGRFRHLLGLQWVPFVDYGNVWKVGEKLTPSGEGRAVGLGIRYVFLSLFNIRIDYAWDPRNSSRYKWILDLAQAF